MEGASAEASGGRMPLVESEGSKEAAMLDTNVALRFQMYLYRLLVSPRA